MPKSNHEILNDAHDHADWVCNTLAHKVYVWAYRHGYKHGYKDAKAEEMAKEPIV